MSAPSKAKSFVVEVDALDPMPACNSEVAAVLTRILLKAAAAGNGSGDRDE